MASLMYSTMRTDTLSQERRVWLLLVQKLQKELEEYTLSVP